MVDGSQMAFRVPLPDALYSSPLTRALRTNAITLDGIVDRAARRTTVVEVSGHVVCGATGLHGLQYCREENGVHTCDKRRSKTYINDEFPKFDVEEGFSEDDRLWEADVRETKGQVDQRAREVLGRIFAEESATCEWFQFILRNLIEVLFTVADISITAHGGWINAFLRVVGHSPVRLPTGGESSALSPNGALLMLQL